MLSAESKTLMEQLQAPFPVSDIEWRIGQAGMTKDAKPWANVFAYITARAVHDRLDQVVGPGNWRVEFRELTVDGKSGVLCGLSIKLDGEWVTKWDGANPTDTEPFKGGLSDAVKRAAAVWGIGRYLYKLDVGWAQFSASGQYKHKMKDGSWHKWDPPALPQWAQPKAA